MKKILMTVSAVFVICFIAVTALATGQKEKTGKKLTIAYVVKQATHPWFMMEIAALKAKSDKLGIEFKVIDANSDNELFMQGVETSIGQKVDALLLVPTDQSLGPAIADMARKAGIPVATIDDSLKDKDGKDLPHFGVNTNAMGTVGGHGLAKLAKEKGFFKPGNVVKIMVLDMSFLSVVHERMLGYIEALKQDVPELKNEDFIIEDTKDAMFEAALPVASSILNAHPEVTHWIGTTVTDDAAIAILRIMEENGFPLEKVLVSGMGGFKMAYDEFQKDHNSLATVKLDPILESDTAIQQIYDHLTKGKALTGALIMPVAFAHKACPFGKSA